MRVVAGVSPRGLARGAIAAMFAVSVAACSTDTHRFNANPFAERDPGPQAEVTGSVVPAQRAPVAKIESRPLQSAQPAVTGHSGVQARPSDPASTGSIATSATKVASATRPAPAAGTTHVVVRGDTLMNLSRRYHLSLRDIASANQLTYDARLKIGDRITIPGDARHAPAAPAPAASAAKPTIAAAPVAKPQPVTAAPSHVASRQTPVNAEAPASARIASPATEPAERTSTTASAVPQFRWPVRGRVISGFGPLPNGQQNDGVNLSVPEGTAVRAADDGVVAYSGSELKGYGNLILVRHGDGFVTAYAHASELMVKRGDTVRRGQVIAKSGATGNVTAPQLHFEIRKGSAPVDPTRYLSGA